MHTSSWSRCGGIAEEGGGLSGEQGNKGSGFAKKGYVASFLFKCCFNSWNYTRYLISREITFLFFFFTKQRTQLLGWYSKLSPTKDELASH